VAEISHFQLGSCFKSKAMSLSLPLQAVEQPAFTSFRSFVEGLSDPTLILTTSGTILYANAEARVRFASLAVNKNSPFSEFLEQAFPGSDLLPVRAAIERFATADEQEAEQFFVGAGLKQTHMRLSVLMGEGVDSILAATFFDPDADAIMRRLEFVLDSSTDGIFIVNKTNHIVFFNKACEKLTGWQRNAAVMQTYECANVLQCHNQEGQSLGSEHLCPAKVFFHKDSEPKPHEMLITTTAGKERYVETNYSPIKNAAGEVEFIVGIIRDIDERKRLESQVAQNRNLVMLGQLISGVAHEIRNPLGILMSSVEIVLNEKRPEGQRLEAASYIKDEIRRLDERMKDFLNFARPRALQLDHVDVGALIRRTAASYQSTMTRQGFHIIPQMCAHTPPTIADSDMLHQVFLNLIINADHAMAQGGTLTIRTETEGETIRIHFADTGPGIAEDHLSKLFDPFFTTKAHGSGLGLSIVQQIMHAHGGSIAAQNNLSKAGAVFTVELPIVRSGTR